MQWYKDVTRPSQQRILIFNCSHERNVGQLLRILFDGCLFDGVIFCPADVGRPSRQPLPSITHVAKNMGVVVTEEEEEEERQVSNASNTSRAAWQAIMSQAWNRLIMQETNMTDKRMTDITKSIRLTGGVSHVCESIDEALAVVRAASIEDGGESGINGGDRGDRGDGDEVATTKRPEYQVLVTGSLYLVGGVLDRLGWSPDFGFSK